ncbi:TonB-dependent receptor [uncultured Phenylobacterium sp.]|uniref:TonB-dependent receptor n=1 Tax=uncultured Phenylobacterium sp. TaxID=349273 RepID=UPI0025F2C45C|nr:TonB-dependent receptor [uncultured Phenylobacterium sp.]
MLRTLTIAALFALAPISAFAEVADEAPIETGAVEEIYVWGKREGRIGEATTASEGQVSFGAYSNRPLLRPGELAEVVPGLAATQHSGSGKANQFFLRGFNLDHGTDFSISLDGVPLNLRSHAHGQGYLDINGTTPELVQTIDYRKGPYFAQVGDFSAAGTAAFRTFDTLPESFIQAQVGENRFGRVVAGLNVGSGLLGLDLTTSDGPWVREENLRKVSALGRFDLAGWSVTALAYDAKWDSTDQIPRRALRAGTLSRLGTIDTTDGGKTSRFILSARRHPDADSDLVVYLQRYKLNLWSNFTYFLDDPVNGDQFEQAESRWIAGASGYRTWRPSESWTVRLGAETRLDDIGPIGLYRTRVRQRLSTDRRDELRELSGGVWATAAWASGPFRASLGLRADAIHVDVDSGNPLNSGEATDALLSPKLTLAWRVSPSVELYADAGRGFHSNDARGAVQRISPTTSDPVEKVPLFAAADGAELGARFEQGGFSASVALWALRLESELVYVGDAGDTESTDGTKRLGVEVLASWSPRPGLNFDVSGAATRARYRGDPPDGDRIPNALEYVITAGATARVLPDGVLQANLRRLGPAPLIEDDSARSKSATVVNLAYTHTFGPVAVTLDVLNLLDSRDNDITYFYASRLPGEPAEGVEDIHFHPIEPRQVRVGLRYAF